jgi:phage terminase large subunit
MQIRLPEKIGDVYQLPRGECRYRVLYGGRGSGKSYSAALMAAVWGLVEPLRILCVREYQVSIRESMFAEIANAIADNPVLSVFYSVGRDFIRGQNGTEFIFKGLRYNVQSIKSMAQVDLCIVEEAEDVPANSWRYLIPTIRKEKSEIWVIFNPRDRESYVADTFLQAKKLPPRTAISRVNFNDNPWFPSTLEETRAFDRTHMDPALYAHVWEGAYYVESEAIVFHGKFRISDDIPTGGSVYYGLDFGFSSSPTAGNRVVIHDNRIYITHEVHGLKMELDDTAAACIECLPDVEKYVLRCDSARPESISHLKRRGLPRATAAIKGRGSVVDGIAFLKTHAPIIIHPRCIKTIENFRLYSYKVDRHTGEVLPELIEKEDHHIDAIRYALSKVMGKRVGGLASLGRGAR